MARALAGLLAAALVAMGGLVWALSGAEPGSVWVQAPFNQRIQVTNVLSRELGIDPVKLQQCLDKTFDDPANAGKTIRTAAEECKGQQP